MANHKFRTLWTHVTTEVMAGAGSLGAFWDRRNLTLVHIQKGFSAPLVSHMASWPLPEEGPEGLVGEIIEHLFIWRSQNMPVSLAVSTQLGFMRQVTLPVAASENLAKVVGYEIDRFLPLSADQLFFDFQINRQTDTEITLTLMALPKSILESWLKICTDTGMKPTSVELAPTAAANAFALLAGRLPASWLLLQMDDQDFDIIHFEKNELRHWHSERGVTDKKFLARLRHEIDQLLETGAKPLAICVYGRRAAEFKVGLLEHVSFPIIKESQVAIKGLDLNAENAADILPALGASLRGVGKVPIKTNLLSESDRAEVKLTGLFLTRVLLILLLSFGVVWMGSIFIHKRIALFRVDRQLSQIRPEVQQVEKRLTQAQGLGGQLQEIQKRVEQYPSTLVILKELTQIIPEHTYLYSLRLRKGHIELGGKSASAADLISILEKSGQFTKTEFVSPIVTDDTGSEIFKIKAEIKRVG